MLLQRELTGKVTGYQLPDSPVQKQIISFISMLSQTPAYKIGLGIDGCGVPVFALPMRNIALAYAKLADPFNLPEDVANAIEYDFDCINQHPEKINDYYTPSYYVNKNPDLLMKDGSRGIICMSIKSRKLGIVVKLEDGWSDEFQGIIIANILEQLKYEDTELIEKLKTVYNTKLYNDCQDEIGYAESDFKLNIDPAYFDELYGTEDDASDSEDDEDSNDSDENSDSTSDNDNDTDETDEEQDPEEKARMRAFRDKHSILGQNVVLPSTGHGGYIQNPMTDPMRPVKSAKVISTVASTEDDIHELTEEE
jgi:hypothetical protein